MDGNQKSSAALDVVVYEALGGYQVAAVKLTQMKLCIERKCTLRGAVILSRVEDEIQRAWNSIGAGRFCYRRLDDVMKTRGRSYQGLKTILLNIIFEDTF